MVEKRSKAADGGTTARNANLLLVEPPLLLQPTLAKAIGFHEAMLLQQIHYWLGRTTHMHEGRPSIYKTFSDWHVEFPFWSTRTIQRVIGNLQLFGFLIVSKQRGTWNRTNWYSIDYEVVGALVASLSGGSRSSRQFDQMHPDKLSHTVTTNCLNQVGQAGQIISRTENTSKTTSETIAYTESFDKAWNAFPKRAGNNPKTSAFRAWQARIKEGFSPTDMMAGVERYATFVRRTGKEGTEFVQMAKTFFGHTLCFSQDWTLPIDGKAVLEPTKLWWETVDGIRRKGEEFNVVRTDRIELTEPENWARYRAKVFVRMGDGPWINSKNVTEVRLLEDIRREMEMET